MFYPLFSNIWKSSKLEEKTNGDTFRHHSGVYIIHLGNQNGETTFLIRLKLIFANTHYKNSSERSRWHVYSSCSTIRNIGTIYKPPSTYKNSYVHPYIYNLDLLRKWKKRNQMTGWKEHEEVEEEGMTEKSIGQEEEEVSKKEK